ncbi:MAG: phage terminase large subunit, partial [Gemmatimonadetes bacterium]|nr:phage terminase large subunit [Gemmatimonadota bacterium]
TRCRSLQARASMGKVYLPQSAHWVTDLITEMMSFPAGKHDDQVDALGLVGRLMDTMVGGKRPVTQQEQKSRWQQAFDRRHKAGQTHGSSWKAL